MGLLLEQKNIELPGKKMGRKTHLRYEEYHCKQALIHTEAVLSRGSWNAVKQQNERADTVEKTAAKEHEASLQYIFRGTSFAAELINGGCFMECSETHILYLCKTPYA